MSESHSGICYRFLPREYLKGTKIITVKPWGCILIFIDQPENSKYFWKWCCRASDNCPTWLRVTRWLLWEDPLEWLTI